jgi:hypothetical protein
MLKADSREYTTKFPASASSVIENEANVKGGVLFGGGSLSLKSPPGGWGPTGHAEFTGSPS